MPKANYTRRPPKIMVVAGEASGDWLGAGLMQALRKQYPDAQFVGLGGEAMIAQGLKPAFALSELSVMGILEVLPHIPRILKRINYLADVARIERIDVLVTIDAPDFCLRVARKIKHELDVPCVHYVSPHVWAWRKGRIKKMARYLDHVLVLFPFEEKVYAGSGLACTFVGHPVTERLASVAPKGATRHLHQPRRLALAPGSRLHEVQRMMPPMAAAVRLLLKDFPDLEVVLPVADHFNPRYFEPYVGLPITYVRGAERYAVLQTCDAALATSGTVNLELAMLGLPMVVGYRLAGLTYWLARMLVKVRFFSPVNLVANKLVVPELLQGQVNGQKLAEMAGDLLKKSVARKAQLEGLADVRAKLSGAGQHPSQRAAEVVAGYLPK